MEHEEILQRLVRTLRRRAGWVRRRAALLQALFIGLCLCLAISDLAPVSAFADQPVG